MRTYKVEAVSIVFGKGLTTRRVKETRDIDAETSTSALLQFLQGRASTDIVVSVKTKAAGT